MLRPPFDKPRFRTYGEFVAFFCEVSFAYLQYTLNARYSFPIDQGVRFYAREQCRLPVCRPLFGGPALAVGFYFFLTPPAANRDCTPLNIMLGPSNMYPESFHPVKINRITKDFHRKAKRYSRTRRPTKYLLIDFGLSHRYDPGNQPPLVKPYRDSGGDHS